MSGSTDDSHFFSCLGEGTQQIFKSPRSVDGMVEWARGLANEWKWLFTHGKLLEINFQNFNSEIIESQDFCMILFIDGTGTPDLPFMLLTQPLHATSCFSAELFGLPQSSLPSSLTVLDNSSSFLPTTQRLSRAFDKCKSVQPTLPHLCRAIWF